MYQLIASIATPIMWVLGLMALGLILGLRQRRKMLCFVGRLLIIVAGLVLYLFSIPAISDRLLYSLESQHRQPDVDALSSLDLVVVLGGGYHPSGGFREYAEPSGLALLLQRYICPVQNRCSDRSLPGTRSCLFRQAISIHLRNDIWKV